jgi:hypothetical protein
MAGLSRAKADDPAWPPAARGQRCRQGSGHRRGEAAKILRFPEALLNHPSTVFCACKPMRELGLAFDFRRRLRARFHFFPWVLTKDPLNDAGAESQRLADPVNTMTFVPQF